MRNACLTNSTVLLAARTAAIAVAAFACLGSPPTATAQELTRGAGCDVSLGSAAVGADIEEAYFGPEPATVNPSLIGSVELLTAGDIDPDNRTVTLPLYRGVIRQGNNGREDNVWFIVTDTTDRGNATALGLNFSGKLTYADVGRGVRTGRIEADRALE